MNRVREPVKSPPTTTVGLLVTCLVDLFRPVVGFAAVKLLEAAGVKVEVPGVQTCCGQPAYNSGDREGALPIARAVIQAFEGYDHVVVPSGSCASMLRSEYPRLFAGDPEMRPRAERLSKRTYELVSYLADVRGLASVDAELARRATYHDACSGLRELGVRDQPRRLLGTVRGLEIVELPTPEACCGFGGTFCVKYPEISTEMVRRKVAEVRGTGADVLLSGDMGCLLNMAGRLTREGASVEARHVAEVLAGMLDEPAIGHAK